MFSQLLLRDGVLMRDRDEVETKLKNLIADGAEELQVIADYDSTLTKSHVNGKPTLHTVDVFSRIPTLSQAYRDGYAAVAAKYGPMYYKPNLSEKELQKVLDDWWEDHEALTRGENMTVADVWQATDNINTPLRDGCEDMLSLLSKHKVPITVVSAGIGEVIAHKLRNFKPVIISNFIKFDNDGQTFSGFTKPTVSIYTKHKFPMPEYPTRHNVLLLGDSLGDRFMADNVANTKTVLKIGFFAGEDEEKLKQYRESFDVVLVEDQTMDVPNSIISQIVSGSL